MSKIRIGLIATCLLLFAFPVDSLAGGFRFFKTCRARPKACNPCIPCKNPVPEAATCYGAIAWGSNGTSYDVIEVAVACKYDSIVGAMNAVIERAESENVILWSIPTINKTCVCPSDTPADPPLVTRPGKKINDPCYGAIAWGTKRNSGEVVAVSVGCGYENPLDALKAVIKKASDSSVILWSTPSINMICECSD